MKLGKALRAVYGIFLLAVILLALLWGLPVYRYLKQPVTAPVPSALESDPQLAAAVEAASFVRKEKRSMDPKSLLGVNEAMLPKFEGMVGRVAPDSAQAWTGMGVLYQFKEKFADAKRCYDKALEADPDSPDAHYRLGTLYHAQNELYDAIAEYRKTMNVRAGYLPAYYSLAAVYQSQNKLSDASWLYREILRMDPKQSQAHNNLGIIHEEKGEFEEALKEYAQAATLEPHNPVIQDNLASAQRELGREVR